MPTSSHYQSIIKRLKPVPYAAGRGTAAEFFNKFNALQELRYLVEHHPLELGPEAIPFIGDLLLDTEFLHQRQVYFYYRQAAEALRSFILLANEPLCAVGAMDALIQVLHRTTGPALRAAAESLGGLPFMLQGPAPPVLPTGKIPIVSWQSIFDTTGLAVCDGPQQLGRSLVFRLGPPNEDRLLVLKLARKGDSPEDLDREAYWMAFFRTGRVTFGMRFNIPSPIRIKGSRVFRIHGIPERIANLNGLHPAHYAIGFIAHRDYFIYPNTGSDRNPGDTWFKEILCRNARLLGQLTASGIVHSAPIPLFHNRLQAGRRHDDGLYLWFRAGRLDRWLASCAYPNLGPTGIRDFEHFFTLRDWNRNLYRHVGNHLLSLLLVTGSYFRNKQPAMVGLDAGGNPIDARSLFDRIALKEIVSGVFANYYEGFTGAALGDALPVDLYRLTGRMID